LLYGNRRMANGNYIEKYGIQIMHNSRK